MNRKMRNRKRTKQTMNTKMRNTKKIIIEQLINMKMKIRKRS